MANQINQAQQNTNTFRSIFTQDQQRTADILILIANHLTLTIFETGQGLHPQVGEFIRYKQISYLEKQMQFLKVQTIQVPFQRQKLIPALDIALSFAKQNSRFRVWTSSVLAYHDKYHPNIPMESNLIFDIHVYSISKIPAQLNTQQELISFFQEILTKSKEGDQFMKNGRFEESLNSYEKAVNQLLKSNLKDKIMMILHPSSQENHQRQLKSPTIGHMDQQKIIQKFQNTCFKYLELCYSLGEYLKVITTVPKIIKFLNIDSHSRILSVQIMTYLKLQEFELAEKHFERMKSLKETKKQIEQRLQNEIKRARNREENKKDEKQRNRVS